MHFSLFVAAGLWRIALRRSISNLISSFHHAAFVGPALICCEPSLSPRFVLCISTSFGADLCEAPMRGVMLLTGASRVRNWGLIDIGEESRRNLRGQRS